MGNDYLFKVRTDGDIIDGEDRVIGHLNLEYIKRIVNRYQEDLISKEDLKRKINGICGKCQNIITKYENGVPDGNCAIHHIMDMIDSVPTFSIDKR